MNIVPLHVYNRLNTKDSITKSTAKLTSYSGETLKVKGHSHLTCQNKPIDFYVVDTTQDPILGLAASQELGIVKIVLKIDSDSNRFIKMHPKLFQGLGCLQNP